MQCPVDGTQLVMTERSGVEIDYRPQCRGVWLDRGELDKIIDRGAAGSQPAPARAAPPPGRRDEYDDDGYHPTHRRKKREGFLGELFDF